MQQTSLITQTDDIFLSCGTQMVCDEISASDLQVSTDSSGLRLPAVTAVVLAGQVLVWPLAVVLPVSSTGSTQGSCCSSLL